VADHLQEEEQLEAISQWWRENRTSVVAAVVLTLGGTMGWSQYESYTEEQSTAAADAYDALLLQREAGTSPNELAELSAELRASHAGDTFADFGSLQVASAAVAAGDLELARGELEAVMATVELDSTLGQLSQLRLARVLAAAGDEDAAIAILQKGSQSFPASYAQALGDIHLSAGREDAALMAYETAQMELQSLGAQGGLVEAKVNALSLRVSDKSGEAIQ
jgi:predicted negative regulator of RcsB-dependent stress response